MAATYIVETHPVVTWIPWVAHIGNDGGLNYRVVAAILTFLSSVGATVHGDINLNNTNISNNNVKIIWSSL